jgi:hypothetical protein
MGGLPKGVFKERLHRVAHCKAVHLHYLNMYVCAYTHTHTHTCRMIWIRILCNDAQGVGNARGLASFR